MLNDSDCEVVHAPGEEEMLGARADEAVGPRERGGPVPNNPDVECLIWEAFQDLLLTLLETGSRSKGALHALAPHCLRPFARLTPEVVQGAREPDAPSPNRPSRQPRKAFIGSSLNYRSPTPPPLLQLRFDADLDLPRVELMLPTLEAVLVAFHKHPSALVHLLDDDVETAYAVFGFASNFCISSLERADEIDLAPDRRARLLDTLRALITPSGGVDGGARAAADWAARAEAALRDAPRPDLPAPNASSDAQLSPDKPAPARAELSVFVQLMRASAE